MSAPRQSMIDLYKSARQVSVPILVINTADAVATIEEIREHGTKSGNEFPLTQWDASRGITAVNKAGEEALARASIVAGDTIDFVAAMSAALMLPPKSVLFCHNAHRQLQSQEPAATAQHVQGVVNVREPFKRTFRMLVLFGPYVPLPIELSQSVFTINQPLPGADEMKTMVKELHVSAKLPAPPDDVMAKAVDASSGCTLFAAEQNTAMSFTAKGLDVDALRERARLTIEQHDGMKVHRGTETFDDLRGLDSIKARLRQHVHAKTPVGVVVWIDEGADVFSNVESDTSGVKTDQQRTLLVEMEQNGWRGAALVGVPGCGKSAISSAFGNEAGVLTIALDLGGMESKYVGESEAKMRAAIDVIKEVGRGHAFFLLTANSLRGIRPQFQARFRRGVFFFDLPTKAERDAIWKLYLKKYGFDKMTASKHAELPDDDGWVGREIKECVESAWDCGISLIEASKFIVPVSRSRAREIEEMRKEAHGRFLDASNPGEYKYVDTMAKQLRAIELPPAKAVK